MQKNYYDILQVNKNASPEIIEKAYKTLAKKYHRDLQDKENKETSEKTLKEINEAYEILSDPIKRDDYDKSIIEDFVLRESYLKVCKENKLLKTEINNIKKSLNNQNYNYSAPDNNNYYEEIENAKQQAYRDAYIQDLKNRGYKIKYKKTFQDYLFILFAIIIIVIIMFLLYQIPFIKNFFKQLYVNNEIFKFIINIFSSLLSSLFSLFKK